MARTSILEYLDNFREHSREVAYIHRRGYRTQRWTYGDVLANACRFARELESRGIGKDDKVLIWGKLRRMDRGVLRMPVARDDRGSDRQDRGSRLCPTHRATS